MSSMRSSTGLFALLLWSAFGPMLHHSTNTTLATVPSSYIENEMAYHTASATTLTLGPQAPLASTLAAPGGYSMIDALGFMYLRLVQDKVRYGIYTACSLALLALIASSITSTGRITSHSLVDSLKRASRVSFNAVTALELAFKDRVPLTVCNHWTLILEYHPYTANLLEGVSSCGFMADTSMCPVRGELASFLASGLFAATMLLILRGWHMSKKFRQYVFEYVSLYQRYESICKLNQQARSARDEALTDKTAQESIMLSMSRNALSEKQELVAATWTP
nr:hypothetical protein CFP56_11646 [Quercus suber]